MLSVCFTKNSKHAFDVITRVLKGDVLAPFLFCCAGWLLAAEGHLAAWLWSCNNPCRSRRYPAKSLNDLDFADDIALLESSISQAQTQLTKQAEAAAGLGLVTSVPKTEYVTMNCNPQPALQAYGDPINHVSEFRYLGSMVASGSSDLKRRKSLAWSAFWKIEQLWKSPHNDHVLNTTVYSMTNIVPLIHLVRHRQLKFLGHILRMSKEEPARRYALYIPTIGKMTWSTTYFIPYLCTKVAWG